MASSINFNSAANQALRTLQATNVSLDSTQNRISTGLKIGQAKDNAAYWAISTTLKSDNKSMATVSDALGLGAATVDTAYQGLNAAKDVLDEIKSKLTAATQDGIDRTKIQAEITELQKQLKSIASSSTFSGENMLSVDSSATNYNATKTIVASFTRAANGSVSVGTINLDGSSVKLYDASANAKGALDNRTSLTGTGGVAINYGGLAPSGASGNLSTNGVENKSAVAGAATLTLADGTTYGSTLTGAMTLTYSVTIDNVTANVVLTASTNGGNITDRANFKTAFDAAMTTAGFSGKYTLADVGTSGLSIASNTTGVASNISMGTGVAGGTYAGGLINTTPKTGVQAAATFMVANDVTANTTLDADDAITFNIALNGGDAKTVRIDQALVNSTLNINTGVIADITAMKSVVTAALTKAGVTGVTVGNGSAGNSNKLTFTSSNTTGNSQVVISNTRASNGASVMSVADIDITQLSALGAATGAQQREVLTAYISVVNDAINRVTSAASTLGSVAKRIDLQKNFVSTLMDTIDKGVSGLIDADMNEESTKLQALQVKQQLGVQALSIANQSAQSVLSLFRS